MTTIILGSQNDYNLILVDLTTLRGKVVENVGISKDDD